ncbi:hypothetical protein Bateq7PJ16_2435 [Bacillus subtilis]|uniref:hypothetical protein n=1 Tax=Bacillus subtilis TaxID=1423 RepID=UPI00132E771F|nr:hypothetical protein [Bacillus subtilis]QHF58241.1 hypothetical protein Bateq7PJ16_2435 [Bacillus subtilis]
MNLKDTFYKIDMEKIPTGKINEVTGKPIYQDVEKYTPYKCDFQPYDEKISQTVIGRFPDTTNLLICRPNSFIKTGTIIKHEDGKYQVLFCRKWKKHFEVFVKPQ